MWWRWEEKREETREEAPGTFPLFSDIMVGGTTGTETRKSEQIGER